MNKKKIRGFYFLYFKNLVKNLGSQKLVSEFLQLQIEVRRRELNVAKSIFSDFRDWELEEGKGAGKPLKVGKKK